MTYPKPIPPFTPKAYIETIKKATNATVPEKKKEAVEELQAEL